MKKVLALAMGMSTFAFAGLSAGEISVGYYKHSPSGSIKYQGDSIDVRNTLKWNDESDIFVKAYLEHDMVGIPNVRLGYANIGYSGSGLVNQTFEFSGTTYSTNTNVDSKFDLKVYDLSFYYDIPVSLVELDLGLKVKYLDGSLALKSDLGISEASDFDATVPMLYSKIRMNVPQTDLSFQAEGSYVTYDGDTFYDAEIGVRYELKSSVGLEVGYKAMKFKVNSINDLSVDSDFKGTYGKLIWNF